MALWTIEFRDNKDDPAPSRIGVVFADTEADAIEAAKSAMGDAQRVDIRPGDTPA